MTEAQEILIEMLNSVDKLKSKGHDERYIDYVLFNFCGGNLYNFNKDSFFSTLEEVINRGAREEN